MLTNLSKNAIPLPCRNGRFPVALLAGAPADRARELRDRLATSRGILVRYHLDYEKQVRIERIPDDVDLVVLIKSQAGHSFEAAIRRAIARSERERKAAIPFIRTQHKFTRLDSIFRFRFKDYGKRALPLGVTSTAYFQRIHETPDREPEPEKTIRATPIVSKPPEVAPVAPGMLAAVLADATEAARGGWAAAFDTATLIRELQARMVALGMSSLLVTATSIEFGTDKAPPRTLPEIPRPAPAALAVVPPPAPPLAAAH